MRKQRFDPAEPANSYEVSYVLGLFRPNIKTDMSLKELSKRLDYDRKTEIRQWAHDNMTGKWVKEHL